MSCWILGVGLLLVLLPLVGGLWMVAYELYHLRKLGYELYVRSR